MYEQKNLITPNQPSNLPNATAALVLGICAIVGSFCYIIPGLICGIIGLVLGNKDRRAFKQAPDLYSASSFNTSNAGRICSIIGLCLSLLFLVIAIIYIILFGSLFMEAMRGGRLR